MGGGQALEKCAESFEKDINKNEITIISQEINQDFGDNYHLYYLLDNSSYLETAYNQVQEKVSAMEDKFKAKFLSYPIPSAIVEEWEKVK